MSDVTTRLSTAIVDRYVIERELGQGGMATVYLAQDVRHERKVALKVLRPELAAVIGAERFLNEIKVTANLQHPHILPLHDSGEADTFLYYVMPYVEGDTLRDKLVREKQLDIQEAIGITRSIAAALDYAHRRGVIHRDIKPENILLHDGQALVADFGIALAVSAAGGSRLTETGLSIGTPHYMSPEQAMGDRQLDARSDIYSLGAMLFEMLIGDPPYTGSTAQAIVAKVITEKAPLVTVARDTVPQHVAAAIHKSLAKLPADRFRTAAEFAEALVTPGSVALPAPDSPAGTAAAPARRRPVSLATVALALALAATGAVAAWGWLRPAPAPQVARFSVKLPEGQDLTARFGNTVAIAPDGGSLVYVGPGQTGAAQLWLRPVDRLEGTPIPGTTGAFSPFFSPDGQSVAFFVLPAQLRVVSLAGGPPVTLTDSATLLGGGWGTDGWLYYTATVAGSVFRVAAAGGRPERVSTRDTAVGERDHRWVSALPGGSGVVYTVWRGSVDQSDIGVLDLETRSTKVLLRGAYARYAASGHIVYVREDGALLAAPFDERTLALTGPATPLLEGVAVKTGGAGEVTVSASGTLVYLAGAAPTETLVWIGRDGGEQQLDPAMTQNFETVAIAPDGRRIAVSYVGDNNEDLWIYDIAQRTMSRLTFEPGTDFRPVWSSDGRTISYISIPTTQRVARRRPADGTGSAESLLARAGGLVQELNWHPDGRTLVFREGPSGATQRDIGMIVPGRDTIPTMLLTSNFNEVAPRLSPDGRWLAYVSDETGRREVYVRPFPGPAGRWQVSTDGGTEPAWAHSGRELFYRSGDANLIAAEVRGAGAVFEVGTRRRLFSVTGFDDDIDYTSYDVSPDDRRFLFIKQAGGSRELVVVLNWFEEVRRRVGS